MQLNFLVCKHYTNWVIYLTQHVRKYITYENYAMKYSVAGYLPWFRCSTYHDFNQINYISWLIISCTIILCLAFTFLDIRISTCSIQKLLHTYIYTKNKISELNSRKLWQFNLELCVNDYIHAGCMFMMLRILPAKIMCSPLCTFFRFHRI